MEEWKKIRAHYATRYEDEPDDDWDRNDEKKRVMPSEDPEPVINNEGMHLYHSLNIAIYVRDPYNLTDGKYMDYVRSLHEKVPEFNFSDSHSRINHDKDFCLPGDMFTH